MNRILAEENAEENDKLSGTNTLALLKHKRKSRRRAMVIIKISAVACSLSLACR